MNWIDELEHIIYNAIKENKNILRKDLLFILDYNYNYEIDERKLRKIIEETRRKGILIGSSHRRGYFIIENEQDMKAAEGEYMAKIGAMLRTVNAMRESYNKKHSGQLKLIGITDKD